LKKDNQFLVDLLKQTKKFGVVADYIQDCGGQVAKMDSLSPPTIQTEHKRCFQATLEKKRIDEIYQTKSFEDELIPAEAFQTANQFRAQHGNDLSPDLVN